MRSRQLGAVLVAVVLLGGTSEAGNTVLVQITTVAAQESGQCDPRLEPLRPRLRRIAGYRSYRFLGQENRDVALRSTEVFDLLGGRTLILLPKGLVDDRIVMQVRLLEGRKRLVDTNVRLRNRGTMVFGVGRDARSGDGAVLILLQAESTPSLQAEAKP